MDKITMGNTPQALNGEWIARIDDVVAATATDARRDQQAADVFSQLLQAGTPRGDVGTLSPEQMLLRQADTVAISVGVDLGAKVAGVVSQSVNKLANMA